MGSRSKWLAKVGTLSAATYGALVGVTSGDITAPSSRAQAEKNASLGHLGKVIVRDTAIGLADDVAGFLFLKTSFAKRIINQKLSNLIQGSIMIGGTAVAGTIAGKDYMNWIAARNYLAHHDDLSLSQEMIPDPRINGIDGFQSGGAAQRVRTQMTGIASPAAGGIFYRMFHNPVSQQLDDETSGEHRVLDPRVRALTLSWIGGTLGALAGMRGGIARSITMGIASGTALGTYGILSSHNPDRAKNAEAYKDMIVGAAPTGIAAGAIYGLAAIRGGRFAGVGQLMRRGLDASVRVSAIAGIGIAKGTHAVTPALVGLEGIGEAGATQLGPAIQWAAHRMNRDIADPSAMHAGLRKTGAFIAGIPHMTVAGFNNTVGEMFRQTGTYQGTWQKSLGVGHLLAAGPHQALVVATALDLVQDRRRSKATSTMPSNRRHT